MSIAVVCGSCGKRYAAPEKLAGKQVKCHQCGATVEVPAVEVPAVEAEPEPLEPLGDPFADMPEADLTAGETVSRAATRPPGLWGFVQTYRLEVAVGAVAVLLMLLYGVGGRYQVATALVVAAAAIILIGRIRRKPEVEMLVARIIGCSVSGLLFLGMVIDLIRVKRAIGALPEGDESFALLIFEAFVALTAVVVVLSVVCYLCGRFGFFNTLGWMYVCVIGLIPLGLGMLSDAPDELDAARAQTRLLWRRLFTQGPEDPPQPAVPPRERATGKSKPATVTQPPATRTEKTPGTIDQPPKAPIAPEPLPPRQWSVVPDPAAPSQARLGTQPMPLGILLSKVERVLFSSAEAGRAVVMSSPPKGASRTGSSGAYLIDQYDLIGHRHLGRFAVPAGCRLVDVSPDGERLLLVAKNNVEVWSLATGKLALDWHISTDATSTHGWAAFVGPDRVVTLHSRRLAFWALPERRQVHSIEGVTHAVLSPGRKQLAVFESGGRPWPGKIVDASTGEALGSLAPTSAGSFSTGLCAFSRDGSQLAALSGARLILWDLQDGQVTAEISSAAGRHNLSFTGEKYLLLDGQLIDPGRKAVVWRYAFSGSGQSWDKVAGSPDGRVWLAASRSSKESAYLGPVPFPDAAAAAQLAAMPARFQGNSKLSIQNLFAGGMLPGQPPGGVGIPGVGLPTTADADNAGRDYVRSEHVEVIAGDDAALLERVRWLPAVNRPSIGIRWGMGVHLIGEEQQPAVTTPEHLVTVTGRIGQGVYLGLQGWASEGRFGNWTPNSKVPTQQVVLLGGGNHAGLLTAAKRQQLDMLVTISRSTRVVGVGRNAEILMRVRINDVAGKLTPWTSTLLSSTDVVAGQRMGKDLTAELVTEVLQEVGQNYALKPLPDERPEDAKARLAEFDPASCTSKDELLLHLVDLRYCAAKKLLAAGELTAFYGKVLGIGNGQSLVSGDRAERQSALEQWLESGEN